MQFERLSENLSQAIYQHLVNTYPEPGAHIDTKGLAEFFGVSQTPIREALMRLREGGLIFNQAKHGFFTATFTDEDILQFYNIRLLLEGRALTKLLRGQENHREFFSRANGDFEGPNAYLNLFNIKGAGPLLPFLFRLILVCDANLSKTLGMHTLNVVKNNRRSFLNSWKSFDEFDIELCVFDNINEELEMYKFNIPASR